METKGYVVEGLITGYLSGLTDGMSLYGKVVDPSTIPELYYSRNVGYYVRKLDDFYSSHPDEMSVDVAIAFRCFTDKPRRHGNLKC